MSSAADDSLPDEFDLIVIGTGESIEIEINKKTNESTKMHCLSYAFVCTKQFQ